MWGRLNKPCIGLEDSKPKMCDKVASCRPSLYVIYNNFNKVSILTQFVMDSFVSDEHINFGLTDVTHFFLII